ncbi:MAG: DUF1634 domain-containing protein [Candidatus Humimicrobiaceae bacterium]
MKKTSKDSEKNEFVKNRNAIDFIQSERLGFYLSRIFFTGMVISLCFIIAGLIIALINGRSYDKYLMKQGVFYFSDFFIGIREFSPKSYLYFAIIILVLTPFSSVIFCIFYFLKKRQYKLMISAIGVLLILAISMLTGFFKN